MKKKKIPSLKSMVELYKKRELKKPTEKAKAYLRGFKDHKRKNNLYF